MIWTELRRLKSKKVEERKQAVIALSASKSARVVDPLIGALKDPSLQVREAAVTALGRLRRPEASAALIPLLVDERMWIRDLAVKTLAEADAHWPQSAAARQHVLLLVQAMYSEDTELQKSAEKILGSIGGEQALDSLLDVLKRKGDEVVIESLGLIGDKRAVEPLLGALKDPRPWIQKAAQTALDKTERKWTRSAAAQKAMPSFVAGLSDRNFLVRVASARALGLVGDRTVVDPLLAALQEGGYVGDAAEKSLLKIDANWERVDAAQRLFGEFARGLSSKDPEARFMATRMLAKFGTAAAIPVLVGALVDPQTRVRLKALAALEHIHPQWTATPGAREGVPALIAALKHADDNVVCAAAEHLGNINDSRAASNLVEVFEHRPLPALAVALGKLGHPIALPSLISALRSPSLLLRRKVRAALDQVDPNWIKSEFAHMAVPFFLDAFRLVDDPRIRTAAAESLGLFGDTRALDVLSKGDKDDDKESSRAAAKSLKLILARHGKPGG